MRLFHLLKCGSQAFVEILELSLKNLCSLKNMIH